MLEQRVTSEICVTSRPAASNSFMHSTHTPALCAAGGFLILLALRNHTLFTSPQLWAEDVDIYFSDDRLWGYQALLTPHNGFVQFGCRFTAWVAGFFDASAAPRIYATFFVLAMMSTALLTFASSAFSGWYKTFAVLALLIAPVNYEVFLGVCYIPWVIGPIAALALYERSPSRRHGAALLVGYAMVAASSPFAVIAAPLVAFKMVQERSRYAVWLCIFTAASVALQLPHSIGRASSTAVLGTIGGKATAFTSILYRWLAGPGNTWLVVSVTIALIYAGIAAWYLWSNRRIAFRAVAYFLALGLALLAVSCFLSNAPPDTNQFGNSARYFYVPVVLSIWTFLCIEHTSGRDVRIAAYAMLGLALLYPVHNRNGAGSRFADEKWADEILCLSQSQTACMIRFNPGWLGRRPVPSDSEMASLSDGERRRYRTIPRP